MLRDFSANSTSKAPGTRVRGRRRRGAWPIYWVFALPVTTALTDRSGRICYEGSDVIFFEISSREAAATPAGNRYGGPRWPSGHPGLVDRQMAVTRLNCYFSWQRTPTGRRGRELFGDRRGRRPANAKRPSRQGGGEGAPGKSIDAIRCHEFVSQFCVGSVTM